MPRSTFVAAALLLSLLASPYVLTVQAEAPLDAERIAEIAQWLPEHPQGVGPTIEPSEIHEDLSRGRVPIRLAVKLTEPVTRAEVTLTIAPAAE